MSDSDRMTTGEKLFLSVVIFLVLRKLLDPKDAGDREKVQREWKRFRGAPGAPRETLFGTVEDDVLA